MKIQQLQQLIKESFNEINTELSEMARVAKKMTITNPEVWDVTQEKYKGTWIGDLMKYIKENPDATQSEAAKAVLGPNAYQQRVNGVLAKLKDQGIISFGDYVKPLATAKEKTPDAEKQQKHKNAAIKRVYTALIRKEEPTEEDIALIGPETLEQLKTKAANPPQRGRKIGTSKQTTTDEPPKVKEPIVPTKYIDDKEERIAKAAAKTQGLEDAKTALANHQHAMKEKAKLLKTAKPEEKQAITDELKVMTKQLKQLEKNLEKLI